MTTAVDITTRVSYLLPTGTFLTFQVLAPLATNNGKCGVTEKALTGATLGLLAMGCILTCFTDSYTAPDGKVYNGFITRHGLWVPSYDAEEMVGGAETDGQVVPEIPDATARVRKPKLSEAKKEKINKKFIVASKFAIMPSDYVNAAISAIAFLTLTLFTDPVSTCFYPHLSETVLKTLPVLLAAVLSFFCTFSGKVRHGYGNSFPGRKDTPYTPLRERASSMSRAGSAAADETRLHIHDDGHESIKVQ